MSTFVYDILTKISVDFNIMCKLTVVRILALPFVSGSILKVIAAYISKEA